MLAILGLIAAACSNSKEESGATSGGTDAGGSGSANDAPGVSDDEIRFSAFGTISNNPLGTCVLECYVQGVEAYFAYRNSEGGVHGRDLVLDEPLDDGMTKNQQLAIEVTTANETFAAFSATQVAGGWQDVAKAGMPLYAWMIHPAEATSPAIFGNQGVPCVACPRRIDAEIVRRAGGTKVGVLGYGVSESSKLAAESKKKAVEEYSEDIGGAEVGYFNDNITFGMPNGIGPEVTAMKDAKVDVIMASIDLNGMKTLAQELKRQGMDDVTMIHDNTYDQAFVEEAGDLFEGDYVTVTFRPFEAETAGSELENFKEWMEETGSEITEPAMAGWINATTAYEGIKAAGPDFTRERVIAESNEQLTEYTAGGLVSPIDFSKQHEPPTEDDLASHSGPYDCASVLQVKGGEFELEDPAKPWTCWSSENRDWSEPEQMNFK
jgi:ABC-type branched-subunit amino acid transport system substrate-binding protein